MGLHRPQFIDCPLRTEFDSGELDDDRLADHLWRGSSRITTRWRTRSASLGRRETSTENLTRAGTSSRGRGRTGIRCRRFVEAATQNSSRTPRSDSAGTRSRAPQPSIPSSVTAAVLASTTGSASRMAARRCEGSPNVTTIPKAQATKNLKVVTGCASSTSRSTKTDW